MLARSAFCSLVLCGWMSGQTVSLQIRSDRACRLLIDGQFRGELKPGDGVRVVLPPDEYKVEAVGAIRNGFKNIVLMGDHGGGQRELAETAKKLDAKHAAEGIRVVYCADVYVKAGAEFDQWLSDHNLPVGSHASIKDTSELWYLGGDKGWIRKDQIATAVTDAGHKNGISGDARQSSLEIGKVISDMKVKNAVAQIRQLLSTTTAAAGQ